MNIKELKEKFKTKELEIFQEWDNESTISRTLDWEWEDEVKDYYEDNGKITVILKG